LHVNGAARNLIIAGSNGRIWIYGMSKFLKKKRECDMLNGHQGGVTIMRKSYDSSVVITAGSDGAIFVYRVNEAPNKRIGWWSKKVEQMQEI
jgi:WD40 repeat protein